MKGRLLSAFATSLNNAVMPEKAAFFHPQSTFLFTPGEKSGLDASQDGSHNQIESNTAIEAEVRASETPKKQSNTHKCQ
jgi:hypothetical protein